MAPLSAQTFSAHEETEIQQWLATSERLKISADRSILETLNSHLASRTTLLGYKPSKADVAIYHALAPVVGAWSPDERTGEKGLLNVVRHLDFVQNAPQFGLGLADARKIKVDRDDVRHVKAPVDAKADKERLKKEKAAAAAASAAATATTATPGEGATLVDRTREKAQAKAREAKRADKPKKEKKEKALKPQKAPASAAPLSPTLIDLRVGHILKVENHPDADSLYVFTIAMGDQPGEDTVEYEGQVCRTVCSGLNGLVPLADMQGRKVVVVCNLKPVKMRGIKSSAMVLAASPRLKEGEVDDQKGPVELVAPPAGTAPGERLFFQGWEGEPDGQFNPKKIWETFQPSFTTTDGLDVVFDSAAVEQLGKTGLSRLVSKSGGACTVKSLKGAVVR